MIYIYDNVASSSSLSKRYLQPITSVAKQLGHQCNVKLHHLTVPTMSACRHQIPFSRDRALNSLVQKSLATTHLSPTLSEPPSSSTILGRPRQPSSQLCRSEPKPTPQQPQLPFPRQIHIVFRSHDSTSYSLISTGVDPTTDDITVDNILSNIIDYLQPSRPPHHH